jgi:hypothetical protein
MNREDRKDRGVRKRKKKRKRKRDRKKRSNGTKPNTLPKFSLPPLVLDNPVTATNPKYILPSYWDLEYRLMAAELLRHPKFRKARVAHHQEGDPPEFWDPFAAYPRILKPNERISAYDRFPPHDSVSEYIIDDKNK